MSSLFEIVDEFRELYDLATGEDVDQQTFEDTLEAITGELEVKSAGYVAVIQQLDMESKKAKELEQKFKDIKQSRENAIKRMKDRLLYAMEATDKKEIPAGDFTIKVQANGGKAQMVVDEELVPDSYRKVILEVDKDKIRKALDEGEKLTFAHLEPRGKHIAIK